MVKNYYSNSWNKRTQELKNIGVINDEEKKSLHQLIDSPDKENEFLAKELIRLKIADALVQGLNSGQTEAFIQIVDYLRNPQCDGAVLKGYAGSGKTFLIKKVIEYIRTAYPARKIAVTAPTNKAVHVLSRNNSFAHKSAIFEDFKEPESKIVYSTIHKLLGLKENISDSGVQSFVAEKKKDSDLTKYSYLIVDEVSMLNDEILMDLMEYKNDIRFIFMGDPCQIPPVNKEHCLPFMDDCPFDFLKLELTEIMRQKGDNPIIDYSMTIRNNLIKPHPISQLKTIVTSDGKGDGVIYINGKTQRSRVRQLIEIYYKDANYIDNADFIKVIAWRNKTVAYLNNVIKEVIYGDQKRRFNIGDKLVANKPLFNREKWKGKMMFGGWNYTIKSNTSDEFVVEKIDIITMTFSEQHRSSPRVNFDGKFYKLSCKRTAGNQIITLYVIHEDSEKEYQETLRDLKTAAIDSRQQDTWIMYYNAMKWSDNITHNYAITAHKSQGSTYDNVILIEEDLNHNERIVERNRIKYTAYTRASKRLYILY